MNWLSVSIGLVGVLAILVPSPGFQYWHGELFALSPNPWYEQRWIAILERY